MDKDIRILVLQRGHVVVGEFSTYGDQIRINNASVLGIKVHLTSDLN